MKKILFFLAVILVIGIHCDNSEKDNSNETVNKPGFEEFILQNKFEEVPDGYLVDGDMVVSVEMIEQLYKNYSTLVKGYFHKTQRWTMSQVRNLSYSFTTSMATNSLSDSTVKSAFRAATIVWNNACPNIKFYHVPEGGVVSVNTENLGRDYAAARSYYPNISPQKITINLDSIEYVNGSRDYSIDTYEEMVGLYTHEIGHTLGLLHEHRRTDASPIYSWAFDYRTGGGLNYGAYDIDSIMNYRDDRFLNGLSAGDRASVQYLYGTKVYIDYTIPTPYAYPRISGGSGDFSYSWYVDGVKVSTSSTLNISYYLYVKHSCQGTMTLQLKVQDNRYAETLQSNVYTISVPYFCGNPY